MRLLLFGLLLALPARSAETNFVELKFSTNRTSHISRIHLSSAAFRLNASPYFKTEVDEIDRIVWCTLTAFQIGDPDSKPRLSLGLIRQQKLGEPAFYFLLAVAQADKYEQWAKFKADEPIQFSVDGARFSFTPLPGSLHLDYAEPALSTTERQTYLVNEHFVRCLGLANAAQVKVYGERRDVQRQFDRVNLSRFSIFVKNYVDVPPVEEK